MWTRNPVPTALCDGESIRVYNNYNSEDTIELDGSVLNPGQYKALCKDGAVARNSSQTEKIQLIKGQRISILASGGSLIIM